MMTMTTMKKTPVLKEKGKNKKPFKLPKYLKKPTIQKTPYM